MRRFVALVNPVAGSGHATTRWAQVAQYLDPACCSCVETRSQDHAVAAATEAAEQGACVVAVGGDGLVRDVAAGVAASSSSRDNDRRGDDLPAMAIVPAGRGNDLARRLNLPTEPAAIADALVAGPFAPIDVLDVNGHIVIGNVYAGVDAVAARIINAHRRVPDVMLYRGAGVLAVTRWRKTTFRLVYVDEAGTPVDRTVVAHDIVIANSGQYGHGLEIVPSATIDDGWIDVLVVKHGSPLRIGAFLLAAQQGTHVTRADVEVFRTRSISVSADRVVPFGADGDEVTQLPATIALRPGALALLGYRQT